MSSQSISHEIPSTTLRPKRKLFLSGAQATLLGTLLARHLDAKEPQPILGDEYAARNLEAIDFDWNALLHCAPSYTLARWMASAVAARAKLLDRWTEEFLSAHVEATVLHLACGLDARCLRVRWWEKAKKIRWIDVDVPEVIDVRRQLDLAPPVEAAENYRLLARSVTDDDWIEKDIPNDRPTLVVMEGLLMYLPRAQGNYLLYRLIERFKGNEGQLIFDSFVKSTINFIMLMQKWKPLGLSLGWSAEGPADVEALHPRLKTLDAPRWDWMHEVRRPGIQVCLFVVKWLMYWIPFVGAPGFLFRFAF